MLGLLVGCAWITQQTPDLVYQLDREVIALRLRNEQLTDALARCDQPIEQSTLHTELLQVFSGSEIIVRRKGALTEVVIPGSLLFSSGSTRIRQEALMVLDLLSVALQLHPEAHIWVIGHTDDRPLSGSLKRQYGSNWELSAARAAMFMHTLSEDFSISPERFTIAGRGDTAPIADNGTPEGRELNRRLTVLIGPASAGW